MYHGEVKVADKDLPDVLALGECLGVKGKVRLLGQFIYCLAIIICLGLSSVKLRDVPVKEAHERNSLLKDGKTSEKPVQNTIKKPKVPSKTILSDEPKFAPT